MASTYLEKDFSSTQDSRRIFTVSAWVKRSKISDGDQRYWGSSEGSGEGYNALGFNNADRLKILSGNTTNSGTQLNLTSNRLFRDVSAWYHIVYAVDTTQATESNRAKVYVNGSEITSWSTATYPSQNTDILTSTTPQMTIGMRDLRGTNANFFDGLLAHLHFTDGTQYAASDFGETDSNSGIWKPKVSPSVNYGTNGFFLKFQDSSSLGDDSSGNTNDFTLSGTGTQTLDTPSNVFATYNPLNVQVATANEPKFGNGNTSILGSSSGAILWHSSSTLGVSSGKWYAEFKGGSASNQNGMVGVSYDPEEDARRNVYPGHQAHSYGYYVNGNKYNNNTAPSYGDAWTTDIIGVALDLDNHKLYFSKNGVWQNSGDPTSGATGTGAAYSLTTGKTYFFCTGDGDGTYINPFDANFGNGYFGTTAVSSAENDDAGYGKFEYDVPAGYYALCTKNINTYG
jgi:hypothetical protein